MLALFEGEGEVEDLVAYGDAQGKFAGFGVAGVPEFAGGFLARGEVGGFQGDGADGGRFVVEPEVVVHGGGVVGHGFGNLREPERLCSTMALGGGTAVVFAVHELVIDFAVGELCGIFFAQVAQARRQVRRA